MSRDFLGVDSRGQGHVTSSEHWQRLTKSQGWGKGKEARVVYVTEYKSTEEI